MSKANLIHMCTRNNKVESQCTRFKANNNDPKQVMPYADKANPMWQGVRGDVGKSVVVGSETVGEVPIYDKP